MYAVRDPVSGSWFCGPLSTSPEAGRARCGAPLQSAGRWVHSTCATSAEPHHEPTPGPEMHPADELGAEAARSRPADIVIGGADEDGPEVSPLRLLEDPERVRAIATRMVRTTVASGILSTRTTNERRQFARVSWRLVAPGRAPRGRTRCARSGLVGGRPRARRTARATGPPGPDSEGEPHPREYPRRRFDLAPGPRR